MERIVLATDFSDAAAEALRYATTLAQTYDAALALVHVVPDPAEEPWSHEASGLDVGEIADSGLRAAQARLRTLACQCRPLRVDTVVLSAQSRISALCWSR